MTTTTIDPRYITEKQIWALWAEAMAHGDFYLAGCCDNARAYTETADADGDGLVHPVTRTPTTRSEARRIVADVLNESAARARAEAESDEGR